MTFPTDRAAQRRRRWLIEAGVAGAVLLVAVSIGTPLTRESRERAAGGDRTTVAHRALVDFAMEHAGRFPAQDPRPGRLSFNPAGVPKLYRAVAELEGLPWASEGPLVLLNVHKSRPYSTEPYFSATDYFYLGYVVASEEEGMAFVDVYRQCVAQGERFPENLLVPEGLGNAGGTALFGLRREIVPFLQEQGFPVGDDYDDRVPVLIERPGRYPKPGGWVAYLDGHIEFLPYPGPFPMTEAFISALEGLQRLESYDTTVARRSAPAQAGAQG
ncbi:MAG: hypothetical protein JXR94_04390 [Candidatus Hydrogenedentes bacterium]|nr:hypothetical protein [Candidatus Hydrogenedentota bacterium]